MSQATRVLSALVIGLALGIGLASLSTSTATNGITIAHPIGTA